MFDIGFSEMVVIAVVALVVIGPERLPGVARTAGALFGRAQRYVNKLKDEIQNEVDLEEINRIKSTFYDAASSVEQSVNQAREEIDAATKSLGTSVDAQSEMRTTAAAPLHQADLAQSGTPAAVAGETADAQTQIELWPTSAPAADPATASRS